MNVKDSGCMENGEVGILTEGSLAGKMIFKKDNRLFFCGIQECIETNKNWKNQLVRIVPELEVSWNDPTTIIKDSELTHIDPLLSLEKNKKEELEQNKENF